MIQLISKMVKKKGPVVLVDNFGALHPIKFHLVKGRVAEFNLHGDHLNKVFRERQKSMKATELDMIMKRSTTISVMGTASR